MNNQMRALFGKVNPTGMITKEGDEWVNFTKNGVQWKMVFFYDHNVLFHDQWVDVSGIIDSIVDEPDNWDEYVQDEMERHAEIMRKNSQLF